MLLSSERPSQTKPALAAENLALREELGALERSVERPRLAQQEAVSVASRLAGDEAGGGVRFPLLPEHHSRPNQPSRPRIPPCGRSWRHWNALSNGPKLGKQKGLPRGQRHVWPATTPEPLRP